MWRLGGRERGTGLSVMPCCAVLENRCAVLENRLGELQGLAERHRRPPLPALHGHAIIGDYKPFSAHAAVPPTAAQASVGGMLLEGGARDFG